jgi:hypothetical protein
MQRIVCYTCQRVRIPHPSDLPMRVLHVNIQEDWLGCVVRVIRQGSLAHGHQLHIQASIEAVVLLLHADLSGSGPVERGNRGGGGGVSEWDVGF